MRYRIRIFKLLLVFLALSWLLLNIIYLACSSASQNSNSDPHFSVAWERRRKIKAFVPVQPRDKNKRKQKNGKTAADTNAIKRAARIEKQNKKKNAGSDHLVDFNRQFSSNETHGSYNNHTSPFSYAFVLGGIEKPTYKGFLYSILVARQILLEEGSTQDAILFVTVSDTIATNDQTPALRLPSTEVRILQALRIQIRYISATPATPATTTGTAITFADTVLSKFQILQLTQYQRVLFLDADVMPLNNMDYWFELSTGNNSSKTPKWNENVVITGVAEPAHGGVFLLAPKPGDWEHLQAIVAAQKKSQAHRREQQHLQNNHTTHSSFDETMGWGHEFRGTDAWTTREWPMGPSRRGQKWTFNGAKVDQGLLYYWVKYVKKSVSFILYNHVVNYEEQEDGSIQQVRRLVNPIGKYEKPRIAYPHSCLRFTCDFVHFTSHSKPWIQSQPPDVYDLKKNPQHLWWHTLLELNRNFEMGVDFTNWTIGQKPPLGYYANA